MVVDRVRECVGLDRVISSVVDPGFRCEKRERESQPERNPKEFVWCELAESKEHANDRPGGGYPQANGEGTNHPLAMLRHFFAADVPVSLDEAEQEQNAEECGGRGFIRSSDIHREAHYKG